MPGDLLNEFIDDARDHLQAAGQHLLALEKAPRAEEHLHGLLRRLHSVKGNAGFLNLPNLYRLLHRAEDLWHELRDDPDFECGPEVIDLELRVLDTAETMIDSLAKTGRDEARGLDRLMAELAGYDGLASPGSLPSGGVPGPTRINLPFSRPPRLGPPNRAELVNYLRHRLLEFDAAATTALETRPIEARTASSLRPLENLLDDIGIGLRRLGGPRSRRVLDQIRLYLAEMHVYSRHLDGSAYQKLRDLSANLAAAVEEEGAGLMPRE